ncbi:hypothetical protein M0R19_03485 [Candidatus Pacearchaeota archaeon]|jgi:hypothetical protein|nr:hypothetical protein [Candidatus Pacearchaeota archaeon]
MKKNTKVNLFFKELNMTISQIEKKEKDLANILFHISISNDVSKKDTLSLLKSRIEKEIAFLNDYLSVLEENRSTENAKLTTIAR